MGWYYDPHVNRKELIKELTSPQRLAAKDGGRVERETITKKFKGVFSGVLYAVHQDSFFRADGTLDKTKRWIGVYLLKFKRNAGWGYKPMEEGMGPCSYSCPKKYLEMVPEVTNQGWRDMVLQHHARMKLGFNERGGFTYARCGDCRKICMVSKLEPVLLPDGAESPFPGTRVVGLCPTCGGRCYAPLVLVPASKGATSVVEAGSR